MFYLYKMIRSETFLEASFRVEFDQRSHGNFKDSVSPVQLAASGRSCGWWGGSPFTTESQLVVAALDLHNPEHAIDWDIAIDNTSRRDIFIYPWATVETDIDSAPEENVIGLGEFKGPEPGRQSIAIDRVEILEKIRIHRTPKKFNWTFQFDLIGWILKWNWF